MTADAKPAPTPWRLVILLGALVAFAPLGIDMYLPALPAIGKSLGATAEQAQNTMAAFLAGMALGQLIYGPASDRFGRRAPIFVGIGIFVLASAACALATTIEQITLARFVQALGGCAGGVVSRAVVRDKFDHRDTARVLSLMMLVMGIAPIVAPLLGGWLLLVGSWRALFWFLAAFGLVVGTWTFLALGESRSEETAAQARAENPLRAFRVLLTNRRLLGYILAGALNGATLFTWISSSSDLIIGSYGVSPQNFGWLFGLNAVGVIGASQVNRYLLMRWTPDQILSASSRTSVVAAVILLLVAFTGAGGLFGLIAAVLLVLTSYGFMQGNTMAGALSVDPMRAGSTSALSGAASFGAGAAAAAFAATLHDGTARPLAIIMLVSLVGSALCLQFLALPKARVAPAST